MLVYFRKTKKIEHKNVFDLPSLISEEFVLVSNNTKVLPARLTGKRNSGGYLEVLLIQKKENNIWQCKVLNSRKIKINERFFLCCRKLQAILKAKNLDGTCDVEFFFEGDFFSIIKKEGKTPLPPYILKKRKKRLLEDNESEKYQTVYAEKNGSIAAPTAGLHFTKELIKKIENKAKWLSITLHIGLGTFDPVVEEDIIKHPIHKEYFEIEKKTWQELLKSRKQGKKLLAVGTTTTRALESISFNDESQTKMGETDLFIYPSYIFQNIDALFTNFHLPKSSLMMMVAAFCGLEQLHFIYQTAIKENYRFYSYGDAMLIL